MCRFFKSLLFLSIAFYFSCIFPVIPSTQDPSINILSIDGGGIRGIIPAIILKNIEGRLKNKNHISECFHVMAGTSTGGLIVLMLNVTDEDKYPMYTTDDVIWFYRNIGESVFNRSIWRKVYTLNGLIGSKYDSEALKTHLEKYLGKKTLKDLYKTVLIPAYDLISEKMYFFSPAKCIGRERYNFYLKDIAAATSAAPTYFPPHYATNVFKKKQALFVDGGIGVNNPTVCAIVHAIDLYGRKGPFFVLSIGCGSRYGSPRYKHKTAEEMKSNDGLIGWSTDVIDVIMYSSNDVVDYQAKHGLPKKYYFRIQVNLDSEHDDLDDASPEKIKILEKYAEDFIRNNEGMLSTIASLLDC